VSWLARCLAVHVALAFAVMAWGPRAAAASADADSMAALRDLLTHQRLAPAELRTRDWLDELAARPGADSTRADALDLLAEVLLDEGKWIAPADRAVAAAAVEAQRAARGAESPQVGNSLIMQARLMYRAGDWEHARPLAERGLALCERAYGERHRSVLRGLHYLANIEENDGDFEAAERHYAREIAVADTLLGARSAELGNALNSLGVLYRKTGRLSEARRLYEQALAIREAALGPDSPDLVFNLNNLANLMTRMGDLARARTFYDRALSLVERGLGPEHPYVAFTLGNRAGLETAAGDTVMALADLQRAAALVEKTEGADHPDLSYHLDDLGVLWAARGDTARARVALDRALELRVRAYGADRPEVASVLGDRAHLDLMRGDVAGADSDARAALAIRERSLGPENPDVAQSLIELAGIRRAAGDDSAALVLALRGEAVALEHFRLTARVLEERVALEYAARRPSGLDLALTLAATHPRVSRFVASAWEALAQGRARVLDEMARRHRVLAASADPEAAALRDSFTGAAERLAYLLEGGVGGSNTARERLRAERERRDRFEFALATRSAAFRGEEAADTAGLRAARARLRHGEALIAFARYLEAPAAGTDPAWYLRPEAEPARARYLALVARGGDAKVRAIALGSAATIDSAVARYVREAGTRPPPLARAAEAARLRALGLDVRARVWDPLRRATAGARRLFLVPDGALLLLNFATLPGAPGRYLVEDATPLQPLAAERDLARPPGRPATGRGLLAMGAPDFERADTPDPAAPRPEAPAGHAKGGAESAPAVCADFAALRFEPLVSAGEEVDTVAAIWRSASTEPVRVLVGRRATETAFRRFAPSYRWLHVATHGFVLPGDCGGAGARASDVADTIAFENPLLRSGLALAGANRRAGAANAGADGILTADEIAQLDLSGVELAVLSACETGRGDVRGSEGVLGLRRALQIAGVRTVLMSLWSVDDDATRQWMSALYVARLRAGLDVAAAVREADVAVLRSRRARGESDHPYYWGAFVSCGEGR